MDAARTERPGSQACRRRVLSISKMQRCRRAAAFFFGLVSGIPAPHLPLSDDLAWQQIVHAARIDTIAPHPIQFLHHKCRGSSVVERRPEKAGVASSILAPGTTIAAAVPSTPSQSQTPVAMYMRTIGCSLILPT